MLVFVLDFGKGVGDNRSVVASWIGDSYLLHAYGGNAGDYWSHVPGFRWVSRVAKASAHGMGRDIGAVSDCGGGNVDRPWLVAVVTRYVSLGIDDRHHVYGVCSH